MSENSPLWFGNLAKSQIVNEIKSIAESTDRDLVVVELGTGRGGYRDLYVSESEYVRTSLLEPHLPISKYLGMCFDGASIEFNQNLETLHGIADIGITLFVLPHVDRKISQFQNASQNLKKKVFSL